jgi:hypothetical protein
VIHHVTLESTAGLIPEEVAFWALLGFREVPAPDGAGEGTVWLESGGAQIHLLRTEDPVVPPGAHPAVVVTGFEEVFGRLAEAGHPVEMRTSLWGEPRAKATSPGGHLVEFMAGPPPG